MTTLKVVELNNKSRKGNYVYVKEDNHPSRYYKYYGEAFLDHYLDRYQATLNLKGTRKRIRTKDFLIAATNRKSKEAKRLKTRYGRLIQSKRKIKDMMQRKVISETTTTPEEMYTNSNEVYRRLLKRAVLDDRLLHEVIKSADQWKEEITYTATIKGKETTESMEEQFYRVKERSLTIDEFVSKYYPHLKRGATINPETTKEAMKRLRPIQYEWTKKDSATGNVTETQIVIGFRTG